MSQCVFVLSKPSDSGHHFVSLLFGLWTALIWLALSVCLCLLTNQNVPFFPPFCTESPIFCTKLPYFCIVFPKSCISLSQSESRNFCMYFIIVEKVEDLSFSFPIRNLCVTALELATIIALGPLLWTWNDLQFNEPFFFQGFGDHIDWKTYSEGLKEAQTRCSFFSIVNK